MIGKTALGIGNTLQNKILMEIHFSIINTCSVPYKNEQLG